MRWKRSSMLSKSLRQVLILLKENASIPRLMFSKVYTLSEALQALRFSFKEMLQNVKFAPLRNESRLSLSFLCGTYLI